MKKIISALALLISIHISAQYPITSINISLPANPDANTANWPVGTSVGTFTISALAKVNNGRIDNIVKDSRILVTIKKGGAKICGTYTQSSAPSAGFSTANKVWNGTNAISLLGQDCILQPGDYEFCVQFFGDGAVGTTAISEEKCKTFTIRSKEQINYRAPQLLIPANKTVYTAEDAKKTMTFRWTPLVPKPQEPVTYRLKVWQIMQGQTGPQAMQSNNPVFEKEVENVTSTSIIRLINNSELDPTPSYIWTVQALNKEGKGMGNNNGMSETFVFSFEKNREQRQIKLQSPENKSVIELNKQVQFSWLPPVAETPVESYKISIVEIKGDQSPAAAFRTNKPFFEKDSISALSYIYPDVAPKLQPGKTYAWRVQAKDKEGKGVGPNGGASEDWVFKMGTSNAVEIDSIKLSCTSTYGTYGYQVYVSNTLNLNVKLNGFWCRKPGDNNLTQLYNILTQLPANGTTINANSQIIITGQVNLLNQAFNTMVRFTVETYKINDPVDKVKNTDSVKIPDCSCNPCKGKSTTFGSAVTTSNVSYQNNGIVIANSSVSHGPQRVIKIVAQIVNVERFGESGCLACTKESKEFGNFTSGTLNSNAGNIVNGVHGYGKQIQWQYTTPAIVNNFSYNLQMMFPPLTAVSCCKDSIRVCTRWSFTDVNCITCDTLICSVIVRDYKNPKGPILQTGLQKSLEMQKMGEPFSSWYDQESDDLPKNFEEQSKKLYGVKREKELEFPEFLESVKIVFKGIRELKLNTIEIGHKIPATSMCGNGDFEDGYIDDFEWGGAKATLYAYPLPNNPQSPWVYGFAPANGLPVNSDISVSANRHTIVSAGPDPKFPLLLNTVPAYPFVNQYALRLGNAVANYGIEKIEKTFIVPPSNNIMRFWYASVFNDCNHENVEPAGAPAFLVKVYDAANNLIPNLVYLNTQNIPQDRIIADLDNPFFVNAGKDAYNCVTVIRQWTCAKIDLSSLAGQTVRVEFISRDCGSGNHYGYTYIDNICLGCSGNPSGDVTIQPISNPCIKQGTQVCVNYTLPKVGTATGSGTIKLQFYQNGNPISYSLTSPNLTTSGTYCFIINPAQLPCTNGQAGYDMVATGNFSITVGSTTTPIVVTSPDPVGAINNVQGIKPGLNNDLVCCGMPADNCCSSFTKQVTTQISMVGNTTAGYNAVKFVPTFKVGPKLIKQVRISVVNFETSSTNNDCLICESNAGRYGNMSVPQGFTGGGKDAIEGMVYPTQTITPACFPIPCPTWNTLPSSEVSWGAQNGPGYNLMDGIGDQTTTFTISLPKKSKLSCCDDTIKICIKYSFTDVDCNTCDTIICYKIVNRIPQTVMFNKRNKLIQYDYLALGQSEYSLSAYSKSTPFNSKHQLLYRLNKEGLINLSSVINKRKTNEDC